MRLELRNAATWCKRFKRKTSVVSMRIAVLSSNSPKHELRLTQRPYASQVNAMVAFTKELIFKSVDRVQGIPRRLINIGPKSQHNRKAAEMMSGGIIVLIT